MVLLYALSPLNVYAVHQGALGQLYAAQAVALLTVTVFGAGRAVQSGRSVWSFLPLLLAAFWLLAGSYNFFLPICLAPAGAWLLAQLWVRRNWRTFGQVIGVLTAALGSCALLFWGRFDGLIERFSLFKQYDFGWAIPLSSPEGWLGILRDTGLNGWPTGVRVTLSMAVIGLWVTGIIALWRRQNPQALAALAFVLPIVMGWSVLAWESRIRANASYDAYKILAVFCPALLTGLCCWVAPVARAGRGVRWGAGALLGLLIAAEGTVALDFHREMKSPPLRVGQSLAKLSQLENEPRIASFNMLIENYWSRLWANSFLLRKPQYFRTHTYEGRLNTALKGKWNLSDSFLHTIPLHPEDRIVINSHFHAERVAAPGLVSATFGEGWYAEERGFDRHWHWSDGQGRILLNNPANVPVRATMRLQVRGVSARPMEVRLGNQLVATCQLDGTYQDVVVENLPIQPGPSVLSLLCEAGAPASATDLRRLSVAIYEFELRALALEK